MSDEIMCNTIGDTKSEPSGVGGEGVGSPVSATLNSEILPASSQSQNKKKQGRVEGSWPEKENPEGLRAVWD